MTKNVLPTIRETRGERPVAILLGATCKKCGEFRQADEFPKDAEKRFGRYLSACRICRAEYDRRYYEENRDRRAEYDRRYREENRDRVAEYKRRYREENRDRRVEYNRRYREENRDRVAEYYRRYREENRDLYAERNRRRRARKANAFHLDQYPESRFEAFWRGHGLDPDVCLYCDEPAEHLDHLVPLSRGGSHAFWNWAPACSGHNLSKGARDPEEFVAQLIAEDPNNPKIDMALAVIAVARAMHEGLVARG